jgi:hypothetical protein
MADKRLEKEEEQQAEDARSEEDLGAFSVKGAPARAATEEMIEDDEAVNQDEDDLNDLEDEEEEAAEDAETSAL